MTKQRINWCLTLPGKVFNKFIVQNIHKWMLGSCGKEVTIGKQCDITWENVYAGNDVHIGSGCRFLSTESFDLDWRSCYVWPKCDDHYRRPPN